MINIKKNISTKDLEVLFSNNNKNNNKEEVKTLNMTYFGTLNGSLGVVIQLSKETFEFLLSLQNEILKVIVPTGSFSYDKWRAYKVKLENFNFN